MHLTRVAIAEATASGDRMTLARSYLTWDWCLLELGRLDEAVHAREAVEIYAALGELRERAGALNNLGAVAYWTGDWDTAIDLYGQAAESARQCGGLADAAMFDANIAEVYVNQGRLDEAERLLQSSMRLSRAAGSEGQRAFETLQLGRVEAARGHDAEAIALLAQAAALLDSVGEPRHTAHALLYLALVHAGTGHVDEAEDIIVAVGHHIGDSDRGFMGVLYDRASAAVLAERGDREGATEGATPCGRRRTGRWAPVRALDRARSCSPTEPAGRRRVRRRAGGAERPAGNQPAALADHHIRGSPKPSQISVMCVFVAEPTVS